MDEVTKESKNNVFASDCKHGRISFWKLENCRGIGILVGIDYSPQYKIQNGIARNRGHFASVINCQRHLFFKMADKNNRSQGKRFPYDILNNLSSLDLFYEVYIP